MLPTAENHDYVESLRGKWDRLLLNVIEKWVLDNQSAHKYLENVTNH
jgi:hypothetical protein